MLHASRLAYPDQSLALEGCADSAGRALACIFSSSEEFEAALIAERRAEGRYGPRRHRRHILAGAVAALALAILAVMIV
jgi:hypothetical protein